MSPSGHQFCALLIIIVVNLLSAGKTQCNDETSEQISTDNSTGPRAVSTLKFVSIVSRHGARGIVHSYPKNPYPSDNRTFWPNGPAQLTNKGRVQMFNLGTKIRYLYNGFLNEAYYLEDFRAYSTIVDRTLMSAELFLAGLFPPKGFQVWHSQLPWQPIPVFPNLFDHTRYNDFAEEECPLFAQEQEISVRKFEKGDKTAQIILSVFFEMLQNKTDLVVHEGSFIPGIKKLWDSLMCADIEGLQLPHWAKSVFPEPLATLTYKAHVALSTASEVMTRLIMGQMYGQIIETMQAKINNTSKLKMSYYSGHDITMLGMQAILGLQDSISNLVNTGSALIFELHQNELDSSYFVKVLFIDGGSADLEPTHFSLPICSNPCDFHQLENNTKKFFGYSDINQECKKTI